MVRPKKKAGVDVQKEAETRALLEKCRNKFSHDLADLEKAKREFSSAYVDAVMSEFERLIPESILNMKAIDFVRSIKEADANMADQLGSLDLTGDDAAFANEMKTPTNRIGAKPFKSMKTPSGVSLNIPSMITPRVDGAILRSRMSRHGEVLFSVNGTPVMNNSDFVQQTTVETKKEQSKVVEQLLQQQETDMSPATRKIVQQLRTVLERKVVTTTTVIGRDNKEEQENIQ